MRSNGRQGNSYWSSKIKQKEKFPQIIEDGQAGFEWMELSLMEALKIKFLEILIELFMT